MSSYSNPIHGEDSAFESQELKHSSGAIEIQCPQEVKPELFSKPTVFIAGGIGGTGNVENWQQRMIYDLLDDVDVMAFNPRRANFPLGDPQALDEQVNWEHNALNVAQCISFWFPAGYSCPITVYELGTWSMRAKPIYVGIDQEYPHRDSLISQLAIARPNLAVTDSLEVLANQVKAWTNRSGTVDLPAPRSSFAPRSVHLSGGIRGCPDWQGRVTDSLSKFDILAVNPRNDEIDVSHLSAEQLRERSANNHRRLLTCEGFCVWFPEESTSPTSLFELGALASMPERPLFVGAHPNYFRAQDVIIQTGLVRPEVKVVDSLDSLTKQVIEYYKMR